MELQYLGGCCTQWKNPTVSEQESNGEGGDGGASTAAIVGGQQLNDEHDNAGDGGSALSLSIFDSNAPAALASALVPAVSSEAETDVPERDSEDGDAEFQRQLCDIARWDHRSGHFPLTDSALRRMKFTAERPKYFYAAGLILFMRAPRTALEEEVFQTLSAKWIQWFDDALTYVYFKNKGPPVLGPLAYTEAEANWCSVRMEQMDKAIKEASDRERLGLPQLGNRPAPQRQRRQNAEAEQRALLSDDISDRTSPPPAQQHQRRQNAEAEKRALLSDDISDRTSPAPAQQRQRRPNVEAEKRALSSDDISDRTSPAPAEIARKRRRRHVDDSVRTVPPARRRSTVVDVATFIDGEEGDTGSVTHHSGRGTGVRTKEGVIVSKQDGRPLVGNNSLRSKYPNNYRCPKNTNLWQGNKLDLGQAFKLACWVHYGLSMPFEKSGDFENRKALFRTAAHYAMSMDGDDEAECFRSPEFPDFLNILAQTVKQMRHQLLVEGRVYFGDNVFTSLRAPPKFQSEFVVVRNFRIIPHLTQFLSAGRALGNDRGYTVHGAQRLARY